MYHSNVIVEVFFQGFSRLDAEGNSVENDDALLDKAKQEKIRDIKV